MHTPLHHKKLREICAAGTACAHIVQVLQRNMHMFSKWKGPISIWISLEEKGKVILPDFPLNLTGFFPGKHLIHF